MKEISMKKICNRYVKHFDEMYAELTKHSATDEAKSVVRGWRDATKNALDCYSNHAFLGKKDGDIDY